MKNTTYTIKEISKMYAIPQTTLNRWCKILGFGEKRVNGFYRYYLTIDQVNQLLSYKQQPAHKVEVIYHHTIWEVRESKMNYLKI